MQMNPSATLIAGNFFSRAVSHSARRASTDVPVMHRHRARSSDARRSKCIISTKSSALKSGLLALMDRNLLCARRFIDGDANDIRPPARATPLSFSRGKAKPRLIPSRGAAESALTRNANRVAKITYLMNSRVESAITFALYFSTN